MGLNTETVSGPRSVALVATAQNGLEVVRFGGLETELPRRRSRWSNAHRCIGSAAYFPDTDPADAGPPIVLVPPMMMSADVYDVTRDQAQSASCTDGDRPVGGRLRIAGFRRGRVGSESRRPHRRDQRDHRPGAGAHRSRRLPRRILAGRHVRLPGRRLSPQSQHRRPRDVRQSGRHVAGLPFGIPAGSPPTLPASSRTTSSTGSR